jgi:dihydroorotase
VPLARAIEALTSGPARVLGSRWGDRSAPGLVEGAVADLLVFDRSATWSVTPDALASRGKNSPLVGRQLSGVVLATVAGGRLAYEAAD